MSSLKKPKGTRWTQEEDVYLVGMLERGGLSVEEVASDLRREPSTVHSRVATLKKFWRYGHLLDQWDAES